MVGAQMPVSRARGIGALGRVHQSCQGCRGVCMGNPLGGISLSQDIYWKILRKKLTLVGTWNSCFSSQENDW